MNEMGGRVHTNTHCIFAISIYILGFPPILTSIVKGRGIKYHTVFVRVFTHSHKGK